MATNQLGAALGQIHRLFGDGTLAGLSDAQLLKQYVKHRDEFAFEALVQLHGPMVMSVCRGILADPNDADDAFQASFLLLARKAGSLRAGGALGGWLHRVSCRVALQVKSDAARRRDRERRAAELAGRSSLSSEPWDDRIAILHEEIDRLPERYRQPIVLCYLEEMTYQQAASHLNWTEGSTQGRLRRAKDLLKARLIRRGVTLAGAGLSTLTIPRTTSAVSTAIHRATVRAARHFVLGEAAAVGTVSTATNALVNQALRTMTITKLKTAGAAALVLAGLTSIGVVALGAGRPDNPRPAPAKATAAPIEVRAPRAAKNDPSPENAPVTTIEVRGRVVDPDGKAVAGATVRTNYLDDRANPQTISGQDGRFFLRISRLFQNAWVIASAPGFGPGWVEEAFKAAVSGELTIKLVKDGPPIEGRLVDLEGRPVAGAQVKATRLYFAGEGDLTAWLALARDRGAWGPGDGLRALPTTIAATTGLDGRFRVSGIGRERIAELFISGPTIATTQIYAMSRESAELQTTNRQSMMRVALTIHARTFEHAVAPDQAGRGGHPRQGHRAAHRRADTPRRGLRRSEFRPDPGHRGDHRCPGPLSSRRSAEGARLSTFRRAGRG